MCPESFARRAGWVLIGASFFTVLSWPLLACLGSTGVGPDLLCTSPGLPDAAPLFFATDCPADVDAAALLLRAVALIVAGL